MKELEEFYAMRKRTVKKWLWALTIALSAYMLLSQSTELVTEPASRLPASASSAESSVPAGQSVFSLKVFKAKTKRVFSALRPVERKDELPQDPGAVALLSRRTIDDIYTEEMKRSVESQYKGMVAQDEAIASSPYRRARTWELEAYDNKREKMAQWTAKEVLSERIKNLFRGADKDSSAMKVIRTAQTLTGGEEEPVHQKMSEKEKLARAHRKDLSDADQAEEEIPTRLKTRMNLIKANGQINFSNPVVMMSANVDAKAKDKVSVNLDKDFKKLAMKSNLNYGVNQKVLSFNVNKKITDQISLDMNSQRYTQGAAENGEKSVESARVTYSLSF